MSELYTRRKWIGQAAGEAALLVTSKAFEGEGEFLGMVLPLLAPLLKAKDGTTLQVRMAPITRLEDFVCIYHQQDTFGVNNRLLRRM